METVIRNINQRYAVAFCDRVKVQPIRHVTKRMELCKAKDTFARITQVYK